MDSNGVTLDDCGIAELAAAVSTLSESIQGGKMSGFSDEDIVTLMQRIETCKRQLAALDTPLIVEAGERSLHSRSGAGKMVPFLRHTLGLSRYDASVRVKITHHCGEFVQQTGHVAPPVLPVTAEVFATGEISRDHVRHIVDVMNHLACPAGPGLTPGWDPLPADPSPQTERITLQRPTAPASSALRSFVFSLLLQASLSLCLSYLLVL
ncbi:DUF222 domain-containing protein [Nocardia sp. NPDC059764]|uniref:DUF222 domain-containing protein n=1 Tax=Nocardia sp. NPDC059764 TaxID=3346939 RepID=UPI00365B7FF9